MYSIKQIFVIAICKINVCNGAYIRLTVVLLAILDNWFNNISLYADVELAVNLYEIMTYLHWFKKKKSVTYLEIVSYYNSYIKTTHTLLDLTFELNSCNHHQQQKLF